jgi:hypothetical protein
MKAERVHRVCEYMKQYDGDYSRECERCPATEDWGDGQLVTRGCYVSAEECINYGKYGNAFGHPVGVWLWRRWYRIKRFFVPEKDQW